MPKTKISVTVDASLVETIDRLDVDTSRSEIVEMALRSWLRSRKLQTLSRAVEAYYRDLGEEERRESADWAELSAGSLDETWK